MCVSGVLACSSSKKSEIGLQVAAQTPAGGAPVTQASAVASEEQTFTEGLNHMKEKEYEKAIESFTRFQAQHVTSRYTVAINYNWGLALEAIQRYPEAVEKYRFVIEIARGRAPLQEAQALYHMALCYEALGDDSKTIAALVDTSNRRQYFSEETNVEVNARLAAAYARIGNERQADEYYGRAEKGLAIMKRKIDTREPPAWLGKALYNMGKMPLRSLTPDDFAAGLKPLERGQAWLLQAASLRDENWSPKASSELIQAYRDAWKLIEDVPLGTSDDQMLNVKEQQDKKIEMAVTLHEALSKLKLEKLTEDRGEPKEIAEVFAYVEKLEADLDALIASRPVQQGLTPAAQKREGIKREGKMVPVTEKKSQKSKPARLKKKRNKK